MGINNNVMLLAFALRSRTPLYYHYHLHTHNMRSFMTAATLFAMTTLSLMTPTADAHAYVSAYPKPGFVGGFRDSLNTLNTLAVGPYPSLATLNEAPSGNISSLQFNKRGYYCDPGYGLCK
ncbi:hypothetical protein EDD11_003120 [Mortierella claussenii]|nr:hypothetical protein EDD11_003120 [Mortierella claussenii]